MGYRQAEFAPGEWYHCYTRSIDKKNVFTSNEDFERFIQALYLSNSDVAITRSSLYRPTHTELLKTKRGKPLVAIGAYALMPNHYHLLLQELTDGGISSFMQKVGTSFAMYFNEKNDRAGNVFIKPFRARHIADDRYLRRVFQYIHLNAAEIFEPQWKQGSVKDRRSLEKRLLAYRFSSIPDYYQKLLRLERAVLDPEAMRFLRSAPALSSVITEAASYYRELARTDRTILL